ncbi:MAG: MDR family MFS transporter [Chthoniobacterales bacterium]
MHAPGPRSISETDKRKIIVGVLIAMFLAALDQTIVAPAMPTIGASLGHLEYLPWIITAYLLTATAVTPLYGKVSDIRGRRPVLFTSIAIFMFGSLICALSPSLFVLILGRALQGLGGGGLMVLAMTVIGDLVSPKERGRYQGYIASVWATASIAGPAMGGFFTQHLHWSVIFWINLPLGLFAIGMINAPLKHLPQEIRQHRLDVIGSVLIVVATVCLMLTLTWGGSRFAWTSPTILALLSASVAVWFVFGWHLRKTDEPLLPLDVLRNPIVATATSSVFFAMGAYVGLSAYIPIFLQQVMRLNSAQAGMSLVPLMLGTVAGASVAGRLMSRLRHYKLITSCGLTLAFASLCVLAVIVTRADLLAIEGLLVTTGFGAGTLFPAATTCVQNAVELHYLGVATAVLAFLRQLGSAIGVAALGAVLLDGAGVSLGEGAGTSHLAGVSGAAGLAHVFVFVFLGAAASVLAALVCFLLMEEKPLRATTRHDQTPALVR